MTIGEDRILLEPRVMRMLALLATNAGDVVSRSMLVDQCWEGRSVSEDAINRVVSRIRKLGAETGAFELQTQRKVGYRLIPAEGGVAEPKPAPGPRSSRTHSRASIALACLAVVAFLMAGFALWSARPADAEADRFIAVHLIPASARDAAPAGAFASELRQSLARVHGLKLADAGTPGSPDLVVEGSYDQSSAHPSVLLTLKRADSGETIWSGRFAKSSSLIPEQQRAVAAVVRYLAVWLSNAMGGSRSAREPQRADVARLVAEGARAWQRAGEERQRQNAPAANRLYAEASAKADAALAIDPESAKALMLRYQADQIPDFPRPGESPAQFEDRRRRADRALTHALIADPDDSTVLVAAAQDFYRSSNWNDAGALLRRAIALDPRSAETNSWYAFHLAVIGRCDEGLRYARAAVRLDPGSLWRARGVPRLMQCAGDHAGALGTYRTLLQRDPGNVSLAREAYLTALSTRDAGELRSVAASISGAASNRGSAAAMIQLVARADAAIDALQGRPRMLETLIDADLKATIDGRNALAASTEADTLFALAYEYAHAGASGKALASLTRAHDMGSTYLPWAMPFGSSEFPPPLRSDPRYAALWSNTPGLANLMRQRASEQQARQARGQR
ncbi:winged helix-turn-helix domain-containing protein [Sphingosinicella sp. BN140058]|uniref:winged helix-turn-helix domain-containing protein n=1 Tax=Sphingosinicella sp. BN140058 TaxID=1892855 RepID=UPI0013EA1E6C|nr:winged helix-turn-helix domain-containing protein [Sphingosinicella sp. BN140058]